VKVSASIKAKTIETRSGVGLDILESVGASASNRSLVVAWNAPSALRKVRHP